MRPWLLIAGRILEVVAYQMDPKPSVVSVRAANLSYYGTPKRARRAA